VRTTAPINFLIALALASAEQPKISSSLLVSEITKRTRPWLDVSA
jgi:hypothetical protein